MTGTFPLSGDMPNGVSGADRRARRRGPLGTEGRAAYGPGGADAREASRSTTIRADVDGGMIGGRGSIAYREKTFEVRAAGRRHSARGDCRRCHDADVPTSAARSRSRSAGRAASTGPTSTASATLTDATFFGHAIPAAKEPKLSAKVSHGELDGTVSVPEGLDPDARGEPFAPPARSMSIWTRPTSRRCCSSRRGECRRATAERVAATGHFTLPGAKGATPSGEFIVTRRDWTFRSGPGCCGWPTRGSASRTAAVTLEDDEARRRGRRACGARHARRVGEKTGIDARLTGSTDAALLGLVDAGHGLVGQADDRRGGDRDRWTPRPGTARCGSRTAATASPATSFDDIEGTVRWSTARPARSKGCGRRSARARPSPPATSGSRRPR